MYQHVLVQAKYKIRQANLSVHRQLKQHTPTHTHTHTSPLCRRVLSFNPTFSIPFQAPISFGLARSALRGNGSTERPEVPDNVQVFLCIIGNGFDLIGLLSHHHLARK